MSGKKRKLNSTNPKYMKAEAINEPRIKEKKLISTIKLSKTRKANVYAIFLEND
tara:strand:- start:395 stop:556 length:162 start_codon:yes stop_codon:yes gene_type:complete